MLIFSDAWLLWLLVPLYALWAALFWVLTRDGGPIGGGSTIRFSSLTQLRSIAPSRRVALRRLTQCVRLATVALVLLALARPQIAHRLTQIESEGIDIVLVIDTSGSMRALDLDVDRPLRQRRHRLEVATGVVKSFISRRPNDRLGLVVFGGQAFTQCPLTLDHDVLLTLVERVEIGMAGDQTAIGSAIGTAVKRLQRSESKSKVIVLLTDGRSNSGSLSPEKATEIAALYGIKIYTVGAATRGRAPFLVDSLFGERVAYQNAEIDEQSLRRIAEETGGTYFRAEDEDALRAVYEQIDKLERTEITSDSYMRYDEKFSSLVAPALVLLLLEVLLLGTRFRKLP